MVDKQQGTQPTCQIFSFFGPPGSGKGTLARRLIKTGGVKLLSTGDLCRKHVQQATEIGRTIDVYLKAGNLIPDELIGIMVQEWLLQEAAVGATIILDGFPRTKKQADDFLLFLKKHMSQCLFTVVNFLIGDTEVAHRLSQRLVCGNLQCQEVYNSETKKPSIDNICDACRLPLNKRNDDKAEVILERLKLFPKYRDDLMIFYKAQNCVIYEFDVAALSTNQVFEKFKQRFS